MRTEIIERLFYNYLHQFPESIKRCAVGIGNQVYIVKCKNRNYVFRCSEEKNAYSNTIYWLNELRAINIPVPRVLFHGKYETYWYLVLTYIEGEDIGSVYPSLTKKEKEKIAEDVIAIQRKVSGLQPNLSSDWSWKASLNGLLDRADQRISENGYFDPGKVMQLRNKMYILNTYFSEVEPIAYLDDISTKNLLIHEGKLSGVIDIDWIGQGDDLTFIAMTYVALKNMEFETDYAEFLLEKRGCTEAEKKAFLFYCLIYCVDFMGERGTRFGDKVIEVNEKVVCRLNQIFDDLWEAFCK